MLNRLLFVFLFLSVGFFTWYLAATQPVTRFPGPLVPFEIKSGSSLNTIISNLSEQKLIRSRTAFKITVLRLNLASKIQAGYFNLNPNLTASDLAKSLTKAYSKQVRVTIPEGLRSEEINLIIEKAYKDIPDKKFNSKDFEMLTKNREGFLFPDTYDLPLTATAQFISEKLFSRFDEVAKSQKIDIQSSLTNPQSESVVIIASLLEREAANDSEMPKIAGVIKKRLEADWPLQIDATVQYFLGSKSCKKNDCNWWPQNITLADLKLPSPYNTYLNKGLPPTPISNPGKSALSAAARPEQTSAWFYLHDQNGKIHFADTIEEHNKNVCTYLKKDCK